MITVRVDQMTSRAFDLVAGSTSLYKTFLAASEKYDVIISSAMNLQLKLVNEVCAQRVDDIAHPAWAQ